MIEKTADPLDLQRLSSQKYNDDDEKLEMLTDNQLIFFVRLLQNIKTRGIYITMNNQDVSFYFILNGGENDGNIDPKAVKNHSVNLTIEYTRNNKYYITRRDDLSPGLLSGCIHKYNIVVKDGNVIITGGSISGWTPGNEEEDIVINGEEINPQTNNML